MLFRSLKEMGAEIIVLPQKSERVDLSCLMKALGERNIDSILLEGGSEINFSAVEEGIVDKIITFISPKIIGGASAKTPIGGKGIAVMSDAIDVKRIEIHKFGDNFMIEGYLEGIDKI